MQDSNVTPGRDTTEYAEARAGGTMGLITMILGVAVSLGTILAESGENTWVGIMAGAFVAIAGIVQTTLIKLGYIQSRGQVKSAALLGGDATKGAEG